MIFKRANRYFPVVEPILKECGVPDDFKYLMAIESNLLIPTRSPTGAAGLWQFMETTAKEYGLEVNDNVDERYNVEKSTRAACQYLLQAYGKYGDWWSVAASYNAGQGLISRELSHQDAESALDLWLNTETSRYMFRIMALKCIMENPRQ
jgi:soluble lytic murein transglycosylase-like protein